MDERFTAHDERRVTERPAYAWPGREAVPEFGLILADNVPSGRSCSVDPLTNHGDFVNVRPGPPVDTVGLRGVHQLRHCGLAARPACQTEAWAGDGGRR
jgi:hypothetical protein